MITQQEQMQNIELSSLDIESGIQFECNICCDGNTGLECSYYNDSNDFSGAYDCSGVCGGDAIQEECDGCVSEIYDCLGECDGDAVEDNCGVCDFDSSNDCVQDCNGDWGGALVDDECGI